MMKRAIIDLRSVKEFSEGAFPRAVHIPYGESKLVRFESFKKDHIALECFSGNQAQKVKPMLEAQGYSSVSLSQNPMLHFEDQIAAKSSMWIIDQQFRMGLVILFCTGIALNLFFYSALSMTLLSALVAGLVYSSITDNCYLKTVITILPWNKKQPRMSIKENQEILTF